MNKFLLTHILKQLQSSFEESSQSFTNTIHQLSQQYNTNQQTLLSLHNQFFKQLLSKTPINTIYQNLIEEFPQFDKDYLPN